MNNDDNNPDPTPLTGCLLCILSALTVICGVLMFVAMICEGVR